MSSNPDLRVKLRRNDNSETFRLKAETVETAVENGLITDSIISGASRAVLGGKLVLELQRYTIDFVIQGMGPNDYPNSSTYDGSTASTPDNDDYGFREELMRASKEWGFTASDGFDTLVYDGREIDGVITAFNPTEDTSNRPARTYDATLEWTFLDGYIS